MNVAWQQNVASSWHSSMDGQQSYQQQQHHQFNMFGQENSFSEAHRSGMFSPNHQPDMFYPKNSYRAWCLHFSRSNNHINSCSKYSNHSKAKEMSLPIQDRVIGSFPPLLKIDYVLLIHCLVIVLRTSFLGNIRKAKQTQQGKFTNLFYDIFHKKLQLQRLRLYRLQATWTP